MLRPCAHDSLVRLSWRAGNGTMLGITFVDAVVKAKKAKKAKKEKSKSKNAEKQKRRPSSSGEGSSSGDDDAAAGRAKQGSPLQPAVQREEWMTVPRCCSRACQRGRLPHCPHSRVPPSRAAALL
ncbi:hypothetical protein HaLaN_27809 [Haematococcus lacustris]|uniref:Uncharacterized protein n=1 Tax=Haematococcus lacustris TaxID=44745 RepID=A0A6A0AAS8_HAELA|nr:hypothetical protein HaLaN_27809 [Haematococcus lacustris]